MSLQVHRTRRVAISAALALLALTACDEAQLSGGGPTGSVPGSGQSSTGQLPSGLPQSAAPGATSGTGGRASAVFEVTGSGKASSLHVDDGTPEGLDLFNVPLPFHKESPVDPDVKLLQVHAAGISGPTSCQITVNGTVVVASPDTADCVFSRP